jgi:hypothetical protein
MPNNETGDTCFLCKKGNFVMRREVLAFHQWTDKGYVFCRVPLVIGVCDRCGSRNLTQEAETLIDEAVRREYNKLP